MKPEQPTLPDFSFDPQRCLNKRLLDSCDQCIVTCPAKALTRTQDEITVDSSCVNCGQCAVICPTSAFTIAGFDLPSPATHDAVTIQCHRIPTKRADKAIVLPCLGGVRLTELLKYLNPASPCLVTLVDPGCCATCPAWGKEGNPAIRIVQRAIAFATALGVPVDFHPRFRKLPGLKLLPFVDEATRAKMRSRRAFLQGVGAPIRTLFDDEDQNGHSFTEQKKLEKLWMAYGRALPASLFPSLTIGKACNFDSRCAAICPTKALRTYEKTGEVGLEFNAAQCVSCGLCVSVCTEHAITFHPVGLSSEPVTLSHQSRIHFSSKTCRECDEDFVPVGTEDFCLTCTKTRLLRSDLF